MLRAYDPRYGKNHKDRKIREAKRRKLLEKMMHGDDIPNQGIYPGLGERWNRDRKDQVALTIPKRYVDRLGIKIVRGIAFLEDGIFVEDDYEIEPYAVEADGAKVFEDAIAQHGHSFSRGPGIVVDRAVAEEDGISSIYKITIWGQLIMYLSILPRDE